jgi:hypothetical protein
MLCNLACVNQLGDVVLQRAAAGAAAEEHAAKVKRMRVVPVQLPVVGMEPGHGKAAWIGAAKLFHANWHAQHVGDWALLRSDRTQGPLELSSSRRTRSRFYGGVESSHQERDWLMFLEDDRQCALLNMLAVEMGLMVLDVGEAPANRDYEPADRAGHRNAAYQAVQKVWSRYYVHTAQEKIFTIDNALPRPGRTLQSHAAMMEDTLGHSIVRI